MTPDTSIYEYAKQNLEQHAQRIAVRFYGNAITFEQLFQKIDCVADHLSALGVGLGTVVTIHMPNCPQVIYAVYATAKLGGICNMVHPQMPLEALKANMRETKSGILITTDNFKTVGQVDFAQTVICARMNAHMGPVARVLYGLKNPFTMPRGIVDFARLEKKTAARAVCPPQETLAGTCVCYMHSSGTTGTPRIAMHCHRAFNCWVENAFWFFRHEKPSEYVALTIFPMFHGAGLVLDMHLFLSCKGTQILVAKFDAKDALRKIKRYRVNFMTGVPAMYRKLMEQRGFQGRAVSSLRQCFVSGDSITAEQKQDFDRCLDPTGKKHVMFEGYGMTEIVVSCFANGLERYDEISSGYPLAETCVAAVYKDGKLYRDGTEGELVVSTNTMMLGYLNDREGTQRALFEKDGRLWLRSGDIGRVRGDGAVFFKERLKNMIIRKGYNIYPGEVEACLKQLPIIRQVCVVGAADLDSGSQRVRACVILRDGEADEEAARRQILAHAERHLFRQAVPEEIRFYRAFPLNQMNKVDRRKLAEE